VAEDDEQQFQNFDFWNRPDIFENSGNSIKAKPGFAPSYRYKAALQSAFPCEASPKFQFWDCLYIAVCSGTGYILLRRRSWET
jgi:hypothetical protein